jgi:outer membrane protein assembly factor BamB
LDVRRVLLFAPGFALLALLALLALACSSSDPAPEAQSTRAPFVGEDWPSYGHDASRSGHARSETKLDAANVGGLVERFHVEIGMGPIASSSGPVIADGRVYVGSSVATGDNYFCFDAATGARVWSANVGHSPPFQGNVGIGSTATVSDGVLVVGGGDPAYYGLDAATGAVLWRHDMAAGRETFAWSSPAVANGIAYVGISSRYAAVRGELRALDLHDGRLLARQYFVPAGRTGADIWNSPSLSPDGRSVLVATGNDYGGYDGALSRAMIALDPATLAIQAVHQVAAFDQDLDFGTSPVFFSDAAGRTLVGANQKDGTFFAFDLAHLADGPAWQRATGLVVGVIATYDPGTGAGGTLVVAGDNGLLFGLDPATGEDRWPPLVVGFPAGGLASANGLVFTATGAGSVGILEAATGRLVREIVPAVSGPTYTGPVIARGVLYWKAGGFLNAWGLP